MPSKPHPALDAPHRPKANLVLNILHLTSLFTFAVLVGARDSNVGGKGGEHNGSRVPVDAFWRPSAQPTASCPLQGVQAAVCRESI